MRMIFICFALLLLLSFNHKTEPASNFTPKKEDSGSRYLAETVAFINSVIPQIASDTPYIVVDKVVPINLNYCKDYLTTDTATFSKEELKYIKQQLASNPIKIWTSKMFPKAKILKKETIDSIFNIPDDWGYFHKNVGKGYATISAPIFLRNYTYCVFYSAYHCGGLCGSGSTALYKKVNDKWVDVNYYCTWVS